MLGWCTCPRTSTAGDVTVAEGEYQRHATPPSTQAAPAGKQESMAAAAQCDTKVPRLHLEALHRDGVLSKIRVQQVYFAALLWDQATQQLTRCSCATPGD
jgi:hypothetical protein